MDIKERELYRSANGDSWHLSCNPESGQVAVRHIPNKASGGQASFTEIGAFLTASHHGPEHRELLRLIRTLVEDRSFPSERSSPAGGPDRQRGSHNEQGGYEVDELAERHGISNDQASRLIRQIGDDRDKLDAEAAKLTKG